MSNASRQQFSQVNRTDFIRGLIRCGIDAERAVRWCDLWEAEAASQGIARRSDHYWDAAKGWIDAHRGSTTPLR